MDWMKGKAFLVAAAAMVGAGVAVVGQSVEIDAKAMLQAAGPHILEIVSTVVLIVIGLAANAVKNKTGIDVRDTLMAMEAKHREAYQSALLNAAGLLVEKVGTGGKVNIDLKSDFARAALDAAISMVRRSVPDAVETFHKSDGEIGEGIVAKAAILKPGAVTVTGG